jgi:hypothetical protein
MNTFRKKIVKLFAIAGIASALLSAQPAFALFEHLATDNFGISIFQSEGIDSHGIISTTEGSLYKASTSAQGSSYKAYTDATTGRVGTYSENLISTEQIPSSGSTFSSIYDRLTFSTDDSNPVEVTYDFSYKTSVFQSEGGVGTRAGGGVSIYDVTGFDNWIQFLQPNAGGIGIVFANGLVSSTGYKINSPFPLTAKSFSTDLNEVSSNSFIADPNKSYGIVIASSSNATGQGSFSNALSTTFKFSNLNGATFESSSGNFLSEVNSVPEPSTLYIMIIGLLGLGLIKCRKLI